MNSNEAIGIVRNIEKLCGVRHDFERGRPVPMWFVDDDGYMSVRMDWRKWRELCKWIMDGVTPKEMAEGEVKNAAAAEEERF